MKMFEEAVMTCGKTKLGNCFTCWPLGKIIEFIPPDLMRVPFCVLNFLIMSMKSPEIENEEKDLPFYMNNIPEFVQRKCEEELKETPERKKQSIQDLRNLLKNDKITKDICFHEDFLIQYLRHSKYNTNKSFNHLKKFTIFRNKEERLFEAVPDNFFLTMESIKFFSILPKRCPDGCTLLMLKPGKWDPNELAFDDFKRIAIISFSQLFRDPMTQINGIKSIYDFAETRMEQLKYITPQNLYLLYYLSCCCIPGRYKEIHILNPNSFFRLAWSIVKRLLSEKIRNRVIFHFDSKELLNYFPKSVLPVEYGGEILDAYATNFTQTANVEQKTNTVSGQPNFF